ncbi:MAG: outer membrane protein assembly factor BamA, partial [Nitrospirae bacterium]|nr:outer membrane protein assembly factor BamA [Nitrospirota bacterium]
MMRKRIYFSAVVLLMVVISSSLIYAQALPIVTAIKVKGLKRIEEGSIKAKVSQKIGEPLSQSKTTEDIKTIFKMGYFEDVKVEIEPFEGGVTVIYAVKEKPTVVAVDFQGNNKFKDSELKEKISLAQGSIADITLINDNAVKLRRHYEEEGYYLAVVVPVVKKMTEHEVAVTFKIEEGEKVKIKEIKIEGSRAISEKKIKSAMSTSEWKITSFVLSGGYYKKEELKVDIEKIKDLYYNNGYLKITVSEPVIQLTADKKGMKILIAVSEGEQFKVSSVEITGNKVYSTNELTPLVKTMPNAVFNKELLKKDVAAISERYTNNGYALISVVPDLQPDETKKETKVFYRIDEGDLYKIGRVEISGNTKTKDKVIRREIRLDEGDVFNASLLKRSYERLNNLNYFDPVELTPKPKPETKTVDLDVRVKEKTTGFFSVGGGYSSTDKIVGMVDITQANLFGTG